MSRTPATATDPAAAARFAAIRQFFEHGIPFNSTLGLRVDRMEAGFVVLRMPFHPGLVGNPTVPALHGGSLSAMADAAGGAAVFTELPPGDSVSTIDLRIDYLRPAACIDSTAEARIVRLGGRVGVARIQVWQARAPENDSPEALGGAEAERVLVAEATGVYAIHRQKR